MDLKICRPGPRTRSLGPGPRTLPSLIEWLETYERACRANQVPEERQIILVASYLKGTALTWYNQQTIHSWNNLLFPDSAFVNLFKQNFCNPFKMSQWKHQLRNRKQKPGETVEEYVAAIEEL